MSDNDFSAIPITAPLSDVHKDRIAPERRKPRTNKPRPVSEHDVIDAAPASTEAEEEETTPTPEEQPQLLSPKPVIPPRNALQANLFMDIKNALSNREQAKSEPSTAEVEEEPTKEPPPGVKVEESPPMAHPPIRMPSVMSELNRRVRPKTMDLGDLNMRKSLSSKKPPAPSIPKMAEVPVPIASETKKSPAVDQITAPKLVTASSAKPLIRSQRVEKKPLVTETPVEDKVAAEAAKELVTQKKLEDKPTEKIASIETNVPLKVNEEPIRKIVAKSEDTVKIASVEKIDRSQKVTLETVKSTASEASVILTSVSKSAVAKMFTTEFSVQSKQTITKSKSEEIKIPSSIQYKTEQIKKKDEQILNKDNNFQKITNLVKTTDSLNISIIPLTNSTIRNEIIKNTTDSLSSIKSINPRINNENRAVSEANIASIDKNVKSNAIKNNTVVDNTAVREVTNDLMEKSYKAFKERTGNQIEAPKLNNTSLQSKDTVKANENVKTNEQSTVSNITKLPEGKEDPIVNNSLKTSSIIRSDNDSKGLKGAEDQKVKLKQNTIQEPKFEPVLLQSKADVKQDIKVVNSTKTSPAKFNIFKSTSLTAPMMRKIDPTLQINENQTTGEIYTTHRISNKLPLDKKELVSNNNKLPVSRVDPSRNIKSTLGGELEKDKTPAASKADASPQVAKTSTAKKAFESTSTRSLSQVAKQVATSQKFLPSTLGVELGKENAPSVIKTNPSPQDAKQGFEPTSAKSISQVAKQVGASQKFLPSKFVTNNENVKDDVTIKSDVIKLGEHGHKKRASWIRDSSTDSKSEDKLVEINSKPADSGKTSEAVVTQSKQVVTITKNASSNINAFKQGNLTKDIVPPKIQTPVENVREIPSNHKQSDQVPRKIETKFGSPANMFGKSTSKENLSSATETYTSAIKFQTRSSTIAQKVENTPMTTTSMKTEEKPSQTQTDDIVSKFLLRNNINNSNPFKSQSVENLNLVTKDQNLPSVTKPINISKNASNRTVNDYEATSRASSLPKEEFDPFGENRKYNVFRKQSFREGAQKTTESVETKLVDKEARDVNATLPDQKDNVLSKWRLSSTKVTASTGETTTPVNAVASRSSEIKKVSPVTEMDSKQDKSPRVGEVTKPLSDLTTRENTLDAPAFASPMRISNYSDLLKRSINTFSKAPPDKEEPKVTPFNKTLDEKLGMPTVNPDNKNVAAKITIPEKVVSRWKRPETLSIQKESKVTSDKSITSATFLQGNKITKSIFEPKNSPSTPIANLAPVPESEPVNEQNISSMNADASSTSPSQNKVSPVSRHESPIFNQMFLPKSTFRSSASSINKSTEDISAITRNSNWSRQNRPQTLTGNEHVTIQRTMSATPIMETTIKEKSDSATADFFQEWKNKRRINP